MKKIYIAALITIVMASCTKRNQTCYKCEYVSQCAGYQSRNVCTDGEPNDELPRQDACGAVTWGCKAR